MCLACEQGDLEQRWEMIEVISHGRLPEGHTVDDLRAMGLPVPGELVRETQPDGSILIKQVAPFEATAFVCDTPDQ